MGIESCIYYQFLEHHYISGNKLETISDREIEDVNDQRLWYIKIQDKHLSHLYVDSWKKKWQF